MNYSFRVLVTSDSSGLMETVRNAISIHSIKKDAYTRGWNTKGAVFTLHDYYEKVRKWKRLNEVDRLTNVFVALGSSGLG